MILIEKVCTIQRVACLSDILLEVSWERVLSILLFHFDVLFDLLKVIWKEKEIVCDDFCLVSVFSQQISITKVRRVES